MLIRRNRSSITMRARSWEDGSRCALIRRRATRQAAPPGDDQLLVRSTAPAIGHTEQTGPSARLGNRCRNPSRPAGRRPGRPAAGSCSLGPGIRSPAPGPGAGPGLEKRWGAP